MRGWLGLVIGLVVGAGAMYLVLRPPWGGGTPAPIDAGVVATAPVDAGVAKPKPRPHGHRPRPGSQTGSDGDEPEPAPIVLTAADRAVETRGDAVAAPPRKIDMSEGAEARPLEDSEINVVVSNQTAGVRACVVQAATNTDLRATITIKLLVDGSGRVTRSQLGAPHYLFEKGLLGCAQRELARLHFAATGAPTMVTFTVNLG